LYDAPGLVSGWSSLIRLIAFFSGRQPLTVSIPGKYIGILFDKAKRRPEHIVSEKINFGKRHEKK
jgi:dolichol-phosphate mannosyltransferase